MLFFSNVAKSSISFLEPTSVSLLLMSGMMLFPLKLESLSSSSTLSDTSFLYLSAESLFRTS